MPKMYEAIRDKCLAQGASAKECKTKAAKIYNAKRAKGTKPLSPHWREANTSPNK